MTIETDIFTRLSTFAGLMALIGTRIYPDLLPQNPTLPAVTLFKVSNPREITHSGDSSLQHPHYQFSCWALTYGQVWAVAEQVRLALQGLTSAGVGIYDNGYDLYDEETGYYHVAVDIIIWHS